MPAILSRRSKEELLLPLVRRFSIPIEGEKYINFLAIAYSEQKGNAVNNPPRSSAGTVRACGPLDLLLALALAVGAAGFIPVMRASSPSTVIIKRDNSMIAHYPLTAECSLTVNGAEGTLDIRISKGSVEVTHAACRNQICVRTGPIRRPFQQIICAPNHIIVEIASSRVRDTIDAITQ